MLDNQLPIWHGSPQKFSGPLDTLVVWSKVLLTLHIGCFPHWEYEDFIPSTPENILGIDILQDQILQTSICEFSLQIRVTEPLLTGNANWKPVSLTLPTKGG